MFLKIRKPNSAIPQHQDSTNPKWHARALSMFLCQDSLQNAHFERSLTAAEDTQVMSLAPAQAVSLGTELVT